MFVKKVQIGENNKTIKLLTTNDATKILGNQDVSYCFYTNSGE